MSTELSLSSAPFVYIVGAGPGDIDLLSYKAYRLLTHADIDVVVYDRLIPEEILALVPEHVERIYAGKSCRKHHMTQEEINQCLVDQAQKGKVVLRLKGGDPFIFGRGGEEMLHLRKHNIAYEVVSGVNAADGVAARLGIPLTHRGIANQVHFITGHQQKGKESQLNWQALAHPESTKVIFMGLANLAHITAELVAHGMDENTPAVAIYNGTLGDERSVFADVRHIAEAVSSAKLAAPTLVIIGGVVSLSDRA